MSNSKCKYSIVVLLMSIAGVTAAIIGSSSYSGALAAPPESELTRRIYLPGIFVKSDSSAHATPTSVAPTATASATNPAATATRTFTAPPNATHTPTPSRTPTTGPTLTPPPSAGDWSMVAANPQRTSWTAEEVRGNLRVDWYRPIEPYIPFKVQPIAANGNLYISTSKGLYAFRASDGALLWIYATELPLGHSPTIATINGTGIAYVGGYDRKIHAVNTQSGQAAAGYTPYLAQAGFETNPLVINDASVANTILAGNRDGYFYALDAVSGGLKWRFQTGGPILYSAAYKNGVVYFASNDNYAYALNAANGALVWKSQKLSGAGFHSYWAVIYTDKATGKDYVIFTGAENYRQADGVLTAREPEYFFPGCRNLPPYTCPTGTIGATSTAPDNSYWAQGTALIDAGKIADYFEDNPARRTVFVLDRANGSEYVFDSDGDGKLEFAPFTWSGVTQAGNKYPPVINGTDGIYYQNTLYYSGGTWIPRGDIVGWRLGTHTISRVVGRPDGHAIDEPEAFSSGGRVIYWSLCCDREAGAFDVTLPYGQANRSWDYLGYNLNTLAPDYAPMFNDGNAALYTNMDGWQIYSGKNQSKNGVYGKHGTTQSPPIPYAGKVYMLKGNTLMAFSPNGGAAKLALAGIATTQNTAVSPSRNELQQELEAEVQKMVNAGHLRPGYHSAGFYDLYSAAYTDGRDFGEIFDYFQNPADTVVTLIQALPYLSPGLNASVKTYLQNNYGPGAPYDFANIVHVGWNTGAPREAFDIPSDSWSPKYANFGKRTTPLCGGCGYWRNYPPYSFYAAWKYAQVFGNAQSIFNSIKTKVEAPLSDATFTEKPYLLNLYLAGYRGYLELETLAGYSQDATVQGWYNHLLGLRVNNFTKDAPGGNLYGGLLSYYRALSVARNFMFLTPEVGAAMNSSIKPQVQTAVNEYTYVAPYWFVSKFDDTTGEGTLHHLYDSPALLQAKAYILQEPYSELSKWVDVPAFARGDLFHIQNLTAALAAP